MKQIVTHGIVLTRTDFGEADRIITLLTPDQGKIRVMAKGVRRIKSKLAGGIELFSVSDITYIPGRGEIQRLVSTRLQVHYGNIVKELDRTMLGYEMLKRVNRATEDGLGEEYFDLLNISLNALNENMHATLLELWFDAQLLRHAGNQPNLVTDSTGKKLEAGQEYTFDFDSMTFLAVPSGMYAPEHIKFLRLAFGVTDPRQLQQVTDAGQVAGTCFQLISTLRQQYIRQ